jgi:hypothetical protein
MVVLALGAGCSDGGEIAEADEVATTEDDSTTSDCHPSYTGCVPMASDVDCRGGSGDGPAYTGQVNVVGPDVYGLDRDGDGVACE